MTRPLVAVVAIAVLIIALAFAWASADREPAKSPSPAPSSTSAASPAPTPSPASSAPTPTTAVPSSTTVPSPTTLPSSTPVGQLSPVPERTPPPEPVTAGPGATDLRSLGFCDPASPSTAAMRLSWRPASAGTQLVAIATRPDGFDTGRYTVSTDLPAGQDRFSLSPVEPGGVYLWRVLTRTGAGWAASEVAIFTGPTCVVDTP